ncbi:MAP/microtubule affinity-regulating kinase 4-like [Eulemur rufifrons]|uniref:MAP/microtubule affinity-regulating kinase 4-like n=1 Tax=Eulemur rufifrons TaxID=859984 RepID=UPI003742B369
MIDQEIKIMTMLHHPHIVQLYEVINSGTSIYLIMEYACHGDVYDYLQEVGRMYEDEAREKFRQVVSAVEYCHRMSVAHRDLKPENLLLSAKGEIKLADFGLSAQFTPGTPLTTYCGTPYYVAPEIVRRKPYHGPSADVWSLGVLLYMFVTGTLPFKGDNLKEVMRQIKGGKYDIPSCVSRQCQKLLRGLLVINPLARSSVQKIMEDKWLNMGHREPLVPYREVKRNMNDEKCIEMLRQMGYQEQDIEESLKHQRPNEISATYNFLLQKSVENNTGPGGTRVGRQHSMDSNPAPPAAAETNNDSVTTASQPNSRPPASWHGFTLQAQEHRIAMCNDRPAIRSLPVRGKSLVKSTSGGSDIISKLRTKLRRSVSSGSTCFQVNTLNIKRIVDSLLQAAENPVQTGLNKRGHLLGHATKKVQAWDDQNPTG